MASYDLTIKAIDQTKGTINKIDSSLERLNDKTKAINDSFSTLSRNLSTLASIGAGAFSLITARAISYAAALNDASEASNIAITSISALGATLSTNGGAASSAADAAIKLADSIGSAAQGSKEAQKAFEAAGVSLKDLRTLTETEIFEKVIQGLSKIPDAATRASVQSNLFGKTLKGINIKGVAQDFDSAKQSQEQFAQATIAAAQASDKIKNAFTSLQQAVTIAVKPVADFINSLSPQEITRASQALVTLGTTLVGLFIFSKVADGVKSLVDGLKLVSGVFGISSVATTVATAAQAGYVSTLTASSAAASNAALTAAFLVGAYERVGRATTAVVIAQSALTTAFAAGPPVATVYKSVTDALTTAQTRLALATEGLATTQVQLNAVRAQGTVATTAATAATTAATAATIASNSALLTTGAATTVAATGWYTLGVAIGRTALFIKGLPALLLAIAGGPLGALTIGFVALGQVISNALNIDSLLDRMARGLENFVKNNLPKIYKGIQSVADFAGIAATTIPVSQLKLPDTGAGGGRGRGGATAEELMAAGRATQGPIGDIRAIITEKTALQLLMESYNKTKAAFQEYNAAMKKGIKDQNLLSAVFNAAQAAALQFGQVLAKPIELIGRDFRISVEQAAQANNVFRAQLAMTELTLEKFDNEIGASTLKLVEQEARLASANHQQMLYNNEIRQGALTLADASARLKDKYLQERLLTNQLETTSQKYEQQRIQLDLLNKRYDEGKVGVREYADMLGQMDQRLLSVRDTVNLTLTQGQDEIKLNNTRAAALREIATEYQTGKISIEAYGTAYSKLADQYSNTPLDVVVNQASRTVSKIQELKDQARALDKALGANTITWKQYGEAVKTIGEEYFPNYEYNVISAMKMTELLDKTLESGMKKAGDALTTNLVTAINTGKGLLSSFKGFFNSILNDIAAAIVKKQFVIPITTSLNGAMGGGGGFLSNIFNNLFGGGGGAFNGVPGMDAAGNFAGVFAKGGNIGSGQWGIAGEKGAEVITGPATVTPMAKLDSGTGDPIVVNLSLNAIDTRSGIEFLVQNRAVVTGIVQDAFTRRAQRGLI